jgi:menaquinone-dependent protoporphyrinogen oxidase
MASKILVGYASRYGSTQEVAEVIATTLRERGSEVDLHPLRQVRNPDQYQAVVMGAPLFMFRWHKDALNFLSRHRNALTGCPLAIFALGPTHVPHDEKEWLDARSQLDKALVKFPWLKPAEIMIFGGMYDPTRLSFPLKMFAGAEPASDIRDWQAIRAWATGLKLVLLDAS